MRRLAILVLAIAIAGCGAEPAKKAGGKTAKNGKPKKPVVVAQAKPAPEPAPPEPKKYTVPADAYPGITEALNSLILAAESDEGNETADRDERFRASAWLAMQKDAAIAPLTEKLEDDGVGVGTKIMICRTLGQMGPAAEDSLTSALESDEQLVRINAAEQLAIIKPTTAGIVNTLIGLIDHEDPRTAERAIKSLAHLGPSAKASKDRLLEVLNSNADEGLRGEAKRALTKVNPRKTFQD